MNWETVTTTIGQSAYALWNNGRKLVTLVFHPGSSAARIEFADEKRVFLIRKEGFLKNKIVVRNEYGILIGHAGSENNENYIEVNEERFFYAVEEGPNQPELIIYKESRDHPLEICSLDRKEADLLSNKSTRTSESAMHSLLMTLGWYLFQPHPKERALEFSIH